jgi:hypothetical protein
MMSGTAVALGHDARYLQSCAVLCAFKQHRDVPIARTSVPTEYL